MSEHDDGMETIEASLRRQFAPPNLDALGDRIAAAAESSAASGTQASAVVDERALRLLPASDAESPHIIDPTAPPAANRDPAHGLPIAIAVAVAVVLMLVWPRSERAPSDTTHRDQPAVVVAPTPAPAVPGPPTSHQIAGRQLDGFLRVADYPPRSPEDCSPEDLGPVRAGTNSGTPTWVETEHQRLVWECGGETGIDCADHDLPAKRMMIVRLLATQTDVIVCIEPPGADPRPELPRDSGYNIFRRELGDYVLYEVTPLGRPHTLAHVTI